MGFLTKKKAVPPKCPECRNRKHNTEIKPKIWRCASCHRVFVSDPNAKIKEKPPKIPLRQIGEDIEDVDDFEIY